MNKNYGLTTCGGGIYRGDGENPFFTLVGAEAKITELHIKDGCQRIEEKALEEREELCRLSIPPSVKTIGFMAFYGCTSLSEVLFSEGLEYISACAFYDCAIKALRLPNSVKYIGDDSFSIIGLNEVTLPCGVEYVGGGAFTHNDKKYNEYSGGYYLGSDSNPYLCLVRPKDICVFEFTVHKDCKIIYSSAFKQCRNLEEIKLPNGVLHIGKGAFRECENLKAVYLPDGLRVIDECAFADCAKLSDIKIPRGKITIEAAAFMGCSSLTELELMGATVDDNAFDGCLSLERVTVGPEASLLGDDIFSDCPRVKINRLIK